MFFLYNSLVVISEFILKIIAFFSPKIKLFVVGRNDVFEVLSKKISASDKTIWFHAASLGEYEQGLPVMEAIKTKFPDHKIILTFFSPSGFEVRKNNVVADVTVYMPLDIKSNVKKFLDLVKPEMVFFIKYEFWPNYLRELYKQQIKTYLISGIFRENQVFFRWYGGFYRNALQTFKYFFVQNDASKMLLQSIGFQNIKVSGDTRFDRVAAILDIDSRLDFMDSFVGGTWTALGGTSTKKTLVVIGSSWPKDEELLINYINQSRSIKFVIAPHNICKTQIDDLKSLITKKTILFSEKGNKNLSDYDVLIVDIVGLLTKIYAYADIAFVGGGFGSPGVHNILEPATFGIPILVGPNFSHFAEAVALVNLGGCLSISNKEQLTEVFDSLIQNQDERLEKGHICSTFVKMNVGATALILNHLQ